MKTTITLQQTPHLPTPLLLLASVEDLAAWQIHGLTEAYERGERILTLPCHTLGFDAGAAADAVLSGVSSFLQTHHDVMHLTLLCGDDISCRAYAARLQTL